MAKHYPIAMLMALSITCYSQVPATISSDKELNIKFHELLRLVGTNHDSARIMGEQLVLLARSKSDKGVEAHALHKMGVSAYFSGNLEQALQHYQQSLSLFESIGDEGSMAMVLNDMGRFHGKQTDHEKALSLYNRALVLAKKAGNADLEANTLNNIGSIHFERGAYESAVQYYERSITIKKQTNDIAGQAYNLDYLGTTLAELKRYPEAQRSLEEALAIRRQLNDKNALAINLNNLGELFASMGDQPQAIHYLGLALAMSREIGYKDLTRHIYGQLGRVYKAQGDYSQALAYTEYSNALKDSIYNEQRSKQRLEMEQRYESEKKERALAETQLKVEKQENQLILLIAVMAVGAVIALLVYRYQKSRQQQLKLQADLAAAQAFNAIQQERLRISEELHDNVGSQLTFVATCLDSFSRSVSDQRLEEIKKITATTIQELRKTVWIINKQSATLEEFATKLREYVPSDSHPPVHIKVKGDAQVSIQAPVANHILRIAQEAINNATKYAKATRIDVSLNAKGSSLLVAIVDDGIGFDASKPTAGMGLRNIEKRLRSLSGSLDIQTGPGRTAVTAAIPL